jgi:hypothetical protein
MKINEAIVEMRKRGYEDSEIAKILQEQGISPREINEALSQTKIKQAVSEDNAETEMQTSETENNDEMMPSIVDSEQQDISGGQETYSEQQEDYQAQPETSQQYGGEYYGGGYAQPEGEYYGDEYSQGTSMSAETIAEIVEQNISEKITKIMSVLNTLSESKVLTSTKVEKLDERLSRIEAIIDQLQMSLIRKAGQQEENIEDIKTEMKDMRENFGKVINPLIDGIRTIEKKEVKKLPEEKKEKVIKKYSKEEIKKNKK